MIDCASQSNPHFNSIEFDGIKLANIGGMNVEFIHMALSQGERLKRLKQIAIRQMQTLTAHAAARQIGSSKAGKA